MEIRYTITEEDYIQFNLYHIEESASLRKQFQMLRLYLPLLMAVVIFLVGTQVLKQPALYWVVVAVLYAVGWFVIYPRLYKKSIRKNVVKMAREGDNTSVFGDKTLEIAGDKITISGQDTTEIIDKTAIKEIKQKNDLLILYNSSVSAHIIPTRYLTESELATLTAFFKK